ncbi:hypothetical protein PsorP6_004139 [Peronosclerospora sorghi]|uniref:Uncharacterized protein n=1 Tax=Peronosclerospora sorghi TaxID=230839 RepID=A0ACC0VL58_9STRA|nr:hypothetical protein PsorP6_004139 [Peronosclerospora sorghi]
MTLRLRQLQVIHRHGDRTPLVNIFMGSTNTSLENKEVLLWSRHLPSPMQLAQLGSRFRVQIAADAPNSFQQRPFGYLTTRGIEQMSSRGKQLRELCEEGKLQLDTITTKELQIFSNAYTRTQLSVQALLGDMLWEQSHLNPSVQVLHSKQDILNSKFCVLTRLAYALFPEIERIKANLERDNAEFAAKEHEMAPIKEDLMRLFPAVATRRVPFTWITAADYFVCRRAYEAPYIPGTELHGDATEKHLGFRFHQVWPYDEAEQCRVLRLQFYSNRTILKLVVGGLMHSYYYVNAAFLTVFRCTIQQMQKAIWDHRESKKIVLYSGHDISLLSVLRSMGAEVANDIRFWPGYSSAFTLELLEDENGKIFVRARLNNEILAMSEAPNGLCTPDRFQDVILGHIGSNID